MRKNVFRLGFFAITIILCSCDPNKDKVLEVANQFINAVNANDKPSVFNIYPDAKNLSNSSIPDSIQNGKFTIDKNSNGLYVVSINNNKQQRMVFEVKENNSIILKDTYSVLELDSAALELGVKTGIPLKQISDLENSKLLDETGSFVSYLSAVYADAINGNIVSESGTYEWSRYYGGNVTVTQPFRNTGNAPIKGSDYNIEFNFYCPNGTAARKKIVEAGVDLEPNEAASINVYPGGGYVNACYEHDFSWTVSFVYKNMSPIIALLKNVTFKGNEYDEYMKNKESDKNEKNSDSQNPYAWLTERLATEDDLAGKTKSDIKIMRNTIFAMHGYIFKTQDMKEYFSKQSWYKPQKENVNSELSSIENQNIQFLKSHE